MASIRKELNVNASADHVWAPYVILVRFTRGSLGSS